MATIDPLEHGGLVGSVIGRLRRLIADGYTFEDANQLRKAIELTWRAHQAIKQGENREP